MRARRAWRVASYRSAGENPRHRIVGTAKIYLLLSAPRKGHSGRFSPIISVG
jgi:hypothetical protein